MRGLEQHGAEVPVAGGVADNVYTGLIEADAANLEAASPERAETDGSLDAWCAQGRFGAEGGVLFDEKIAQLKTGAWQQPQCDGGKIHGTADGAADGGSNLSLIAVEVYERRQHDGQRQQHHGNRKYP